MKVTEYEIIDHGVDNSSYFQGCGTTGTEYDECFTGIGSSQKEALEDAANQMADSGWELSSELEAEIQGASDQDEVSPIVNQERPQEKFYVTHYSNSGMDPYLAREEFDSMEEAIQYAKGKVEKLKAAGFPVEELNPDESWEVGEPEGAAMVPDEAGMIVISNNEKEMEKFDRDVEMHELYYHASIRVKGEGQASSNLTSKLSREASAMKLDPKKYPALAGAFKNLTIAENEGHLNELKKEAKEIEDKHEKDLTEHDKKRIQELGKEIESLEHKDGKSQAAKEKWTIKDWAGNEMFKGKTFPSFDDADEFLTLWIEKKYPGTEDDEKKFFEEKEEFQIIQAQVTATGEPDQDYDHELFDSVANALKEKGYDVKHKEFDKYQGVYLDVSKGGKKLDTFWTIDSFQQGKSKDNPGEKYRSAVLIDMEGNEYSANPGDYFQMDDSDVFQDNILLLQKIDGEQIEIENPKKSDLPPSNSVRHYVQFEGEPSTILLMVPESGGEEAAENPIHVEVSPGGKADVTELLDFLKMKSKLE